MSDELRVLLEATWKEQLAAGFVLGDPSQPVESRIAPDPISGVEFRFRWLPHREIRTDPVALERLGILSPDCFEADLYHDPRDESGRHCFLCRSNVAICHPMETLVPVVAGGKQWYAGANFAWLASGHFTVMTERHEARYQRADRRSVSRSLQWCKCRCHHPLAPAPAYFERSDAG
jgi:hypothetical protein